MLWSGGTAADERDFENTFLRHSPLESLDEGYKNRTLSKRLRQLMRALTVEVNTIDRNGVLQKIDKTTPTKDINQISYRYPFMKNGKYLAPSDFKEWDTYQGSLNLVDASVGKLVKLVKNHFKRRARPSE